MNDTAEDPWGALNRLVIGYGRTAKQFEHLLAATGFRLGAIVPVSPDLCVIEAIPA